MAKRKSNKFIYILIGAVVLLIVFAMVGRSKGWIGKKKEIEVIFAKAQKIEIVEKVSASGKVQPEVEVKIAPEVSGEITELNVKDGDSVVKGQLLIKIRPDRIQSVLDQTVAAMNNSKAGTGQARANLESSEAQFKRVDLEFKRNQDLYKQKVISDADFQQAEANYRVAQQSLESARQNVKAAEYSVQSAEAR